MASMERLLVHYVGNINLDSDTLNNLADSVEKEVPGDSSRAATARGGPQGTRPKPAAHDADPNRGPDDTEQDSNDSSSDYPDAGITVQPLDNNAAREFTWRSMTTFL